MQCTKVMISLEVDQGGKIHEFFFDLPMIHPRQWVSKTWHTPTVTNCFEIVGSRRGWAIRRIKAEQIVWQVRNRFMVLPLTYCKCWELRVDRTHTFSTSNWLTAFLPIAVQWMFEKLINEWIMNEWNEMKLLFLPPCIRFILLSKQITTNLGV